MVTFLVVGLCHSETFPAQQSYNLDTPPEIFHLYMTLTTTIPEVAAPSRSNEVMNIELRSLSPSLPPRLTSNKPNPQSKPSSTITISSPVRP